MGSACLELAGEGRQPCVAVGINEDAEGTYLKQVRGAGMRHPLCNNQRAMENR